MKGFLKNVVLPIARIWILLLMFYPMCMKDGTCDYFLLWICVGCPFGITRMFGWLIPRNYGLSGMLGVIALNFIIGGLIGGVVAMYKVLYAVFYTIRMIFRIATGSPVEV